MMPSLRFASILVIGYLIVYAYCSVTLGTSTDANGFVHPGVLISSTQLKFIKDKVDHGEQPWMDAYEAMLKHPLGNQTRPPKPRKTADCGPTSNPDIGCHDERNDALAAYASALAWVIKGEEHFAEKAIEYMSAWANMLKEHTNSNAPLQAGWAGAVWPRVGEIIRYTYDKWDHKGITAFENMLRNVYLPTVLQGSHENGNWELVMMEAAQGISVFLSDRQSYNIAMEKFLKRVPAYIYMKKDGPIPKSIPEGQSKDQVIRYWQHLSHFSVDGLAQETCRDLKHTGYGLASISDVSETSRIQGRDLFTEDTGTRLQAAYELHTGYLLKTTPVPSWLCGGKLKDEIGPNTEVANNALNSRLNRHLDSLLHYTTESRPQGPGSDRLFYAWETLTHGSVQHRDNDRLIEQL